MRQKPATLEKQEAWNKLVSAFCVRHECSADADVAKLAKTDWFDQALRSFMAKPPAAERVVWSYLSSALRTIRPPAGKE
jgi:hypothetical protein